MRAGIHAIGEAYTETAHIKPKHGIRQFDRFLSNKWWEASSRLGPICARRPEVLPGLDWTEFDDDDHATICVYVVTTQWTRDAVGVADAQELGAPNASHGCRARALIEAVDAAISAEVRGTVLADRGFGDQVL